MMPPPQGAMPNDSSHDNTSNNYRVPTELHFHRPLHNLLAALSFENLPKLPLRKNKNKSQRKVKRQKSIHITECKPVLRGTLDPDGKSEDVFYDAQQYGDASRDSFERTFHRESVVLPSIVVLNGGADFEALLEDSSTEFEGEGVEESEYLSLDSLEDDEGVRNDYLVEQSSSAPFGTGSLSFNSSEDDGSFLPPLPPPKPPKQLPLRFLRAGKGDVEEGLRRYKETLEWRKAEKIDTILREPSPHFEIIKKYYPHYCHLSGKNGEACYYEQPPKTDLKPLRAAGVTLEGLLRHYAMVTEFQWQYCNRDDLANSIYIIDLEGIRLGDFVGEVVDFVKRASALSARHYPERAGYVFVINVPVWFKVIWNVVKPMVDETTLKKIYVLRTPSEIKEKMLERIDIENLPPEYGGQSVPLGESPEEKHLAEWMAHNNALAAGDKSCGGLKSGCKFCTWQPARSY